MVGGTDINLFVIFLANKLKIIFPNAEGHFILRVCSGLNKSLIRSVLIIR